ncbi:uncharacterized protein [Paramisgurnus dabryanus]|uniref:uncharacterized protein n=1 Tax=Paramisgurnus dabryanus TaxID=90735 RepID=UPI003CCF3905
MFDFNRPEISKVIYYHVPKTDVQGADRETMKMMTENCESGDDFRTQTDSNTNRQQPLQSTGSERLRMRSYRSVTVCLVLLCVLLLTAVMGLCVLINTNNHQFNIKNKNITEERDQLLTKYTNITEERDQLLTKYTNINKESDQLLTKYTNITEERNELIAKNNDCSYQLKLLNEKKNKLLTHICDGWIYYQYSCYFISTEGKNWTESRQDCIERGADLIIINNKEEQDFIKNAGIQNIWIGLSDIDEEGRWKWVDNSTLTTRFWRSGEPNGGIRENCGESYPSAWNDLRCDKLLKWICEKNILK